MNPLHEIKNIRFSGDIFEIEIDGNNFKFDLKEISTALLNATELERGRYELSPSGYGVHWPLIDEDISIDGLLGIKHSPDNEKKTA